MNDKKPIKKIKVNESFIGTLLFDQPIIDENKYGTYWQYAFNIDGVEHIHFASENAHKSLVNFKKNDIVKVEHIPQDNGNTVYIVNKVGSVLDDNKDKSKPDWDSIAEGKVRHGFAIEAFKMEKSLNSDTIKQINAWVDFVMNGDDVPF